MVRPEEAPGAADFLAEGGEMGALMRRLDWAKTPVGAFSRWPQSLRTAVSILLEARFGMMVAWGPDFTHFYNDAYRPILGSTKHPSLGRSVRDVFPEIWPTVVGPLFEGVMKGKGVGFEDLMVPLDRNGYLEECFFTFSYSPIRAESGDIEGVLVTVSETTGRVLAERRLRFLADLAARASRVRDEDAAWRSTSELLQSFPADFAFALLYQLGRDESALRRVDENVLSPDLAPKVIDLDGSGDSVWPLAEIIASGRPRVLTGLRERLRDYAGPAWPEPVESALLLPITRPGLGRPFGVLVAGISPRRALDDGYRNFFGLVADQIATATANARAYEEERKRAEALAELDRQKTAFFSNISHEFRTPLTLMLGPAADLLAGVHGPLAKSQRDHVAVLHRNALRLQKLVNSLLDFARIEAGRIHACYEPIDLSELTRDVVSGFRSAFERAGLRLTVDCPPFDEAVYVDREMWETIVLNLLSNALKFTLRGGVDVAMRSRRDAVVLSISDSGVGVPPEHVAHLFERFHRVEGAGGRTEEGAGIGLALVHELVRIHGGSIEAQSALSAGTTFTVVIPKGTAHLPIERIAVARPRPSRGPSSSAFVAEALGWLPEGAMPETRPLREEDRGAAAENETRATILLVDDNADMRDYVQHLLQPQWRVDAVDNGAKALEMARERRPDLILSDVMLPGLDGFELLRALRSDDRTRSIPVLMLSARAGDDARVEGLDAGADDYLVKPFLGRELIARIKTHLNIARLRTGVEAERRKLQEAQDRLNFALDAAGVGYWSLNLVTHTLTRSRLHDRIFGYPTPPPSWTIEKFLEHVGGAERQRVRESFEHAKRTGDDWQFEAPIRRVDGDERWIAVHARSERSENGTPSRMLGVVTDITERKHADIAHEARLLEMARTVRFSEMFIGILSHDLRNPLSAITTAASALVKRSEATEKVLAPAGRILKSAGRMERMIDQLLDFTRVRLGQGIPLQQSATDLAAVCRAAIEELVGDGKSVVRLAVVGESVGEWDRDRLAQLVSNLVGNALAHGQPGSPVDIRIDGTRPQWVRLDARNEGRIPAELLPVLFDPFRSTGEKRQGASGLGLGLFISKQIVLAHGGKIEVSSTESEARFIIELPRKVDIGPSADRKGLLAGATFTHGQPA